MANRSSIQTIEYLEERLVRRTDRREEHGCWPWRGGIRANGYGTFAVKNGLRWTQTTAHRISYRVYCGEIPDGYEVDHLCRNRACVNPNHLEAVTLQENRKRRNESKTMCSNGHEYTPGTTRIYRDRDGYEYRQCRVCQSNAKAKRKELS